MKEDNRKVLYTSLPEDNTTRNRLGLILFIVLGLIGICLILLELLSYL